MFKLKIIMMIKIIIIMSKLQKLKLMLMKFCPKSLI